MFAKFSVKKPFTVLVGVILVIVLGIVSFTNMTPDLLPNINLPYAVIVTTYAGAAPESVETVVTSPVEQSMATLDNIKEINSISSENYSMVMLEFTDNANMDAVISGGFSARESAAAQRCFKFTRIPLSPVAQTV